MNDDSLVLAGFNMNIEVILEIFLAEPLSTWAQ
jgi:hypothetical protein